MYASSLRPKVRDDYEVRWAILDGPNEAHGRARYVGSEFPELVDETLLWVRSESFDCIIQADNTGLQRFSHGWWRVPWEDLTEVEELWNRASS